MQETISQLIFDRPYATGPLARADLVAGGIFCCVVYRDWIEFHRDGSVHRWSELIDGSRPLDDEVDEISRDDEIGTWHLNQRGYLKCEFNRHSLTGLPCAEAKDLIAFQGYREDYGLSFSIVYAIS